MFWENCKNKIMILFSQLFYCCSLLVFFWSESRLEKRENDAKGQHGACERQFE